MIVAAVIVYDVADPASLAKMEYWLNEIRTFLSADIPIVVAGNKSDLPLKTDSAMAERFAKDQMSKFFLVSAKTGDGVTAMFTSIADST